MTIEDAASTTSSVQNVGAVVEALRIIAPTAFTWYGEPYRLDRRSIRSLKPEDRRHYLVEAIATRLYKDFYTQGGPGPASAEVSLEAGSDQEFLAALRAANSGTGYWNPSARLLSLSDGEATVRLSNNLIVRVPPDQFRMEEVPDGPSGIEVRFPSQYLKFSPGFYFVSGNKIPKSAGSQAILRLYWNIAPDSAAAFVAVACEELNAAAIPFQLKIVSSRAGFYRCDTAVVYLEAEGFQASPEPVERLYGRVAQGMRAGTPAMTRRLANGVSWAEDPGDGNSYGMFCCKAIAEGIVEAEAEGASAPEDKIACVEQQFLSVGRRLATPYLGADTPDRYPTFSHAHPVAARQGARDITSGEALTIAVEIGADIVRSAVWHDRICNWIGAELIPIRSRRQRGLSSLGCELYSGTAGVGLVLGQIYRATGDPAFRRTAIGAMGHARSAIGQVGTRATAGYFMGWVGVAYALWRLGTLLDHPLFVDAARTLVRKVRRDFAMPHELDVLYGLAGGAPVLAGLAKALGERAVSAFAVELGAELLRSCEKNRRGISWASTDAPKAEHLTGFSHGSGGIAAALLELATISGDESLSTAAEAAFRYEDSWFDPAEGAWADLRDRTRNSRRPIRRYATFWCHGASGIALARLQAWELTRNARFRIEAEAALTYVERKLTEALRTRSMNFSLCHGLAGNAEALAYGADLLGDPGDQYMSTVNAVARYGADCFAHRRGAWPCGTYCGETPNLFLGTSGIAHFYLRRARPETECLITLPRPTD